MSDVVQRVLGAAGQPLPVQVASIVSDADAATLFEQARWLRAGLVVTVAGNLVRRADAGHLAASGRRCQTCGAVWPCASRRLEDEACQPMPEPAFPTT